MRRCKSCRAGKSKRVLISHQMSKSCDLQLAALSTYPLPCCRRLFCGFFPYAKCKCMHFHLHFARCANVSIEIGSISCTKVKVLQFRRPIIELPSSYIRFAACRLPCLIQTQAARPLKVLKWRVWVSITAQTVFETKNPNKIFFANIFFVSRFTSKTLYKLTALRPPCKRVRLNSEYQLSKSIESNSFIER